MQTYRHKPIEVQAVQWFPGVEVEGVSEMPAHHFRNEIVRGYCAGPDHDLWFDPGSWLLLGPDGVESHLTDDEFRARYDLV